ncbi:MAG: (2Fe-2S)-binding protein [Myxococcales bacterium]|nr:(2Fe-2S)-binding protein [Myxococcales bacterium]
MAADLIPLGDPTLRQKARLSLAVNGEARELLVDGYKTLLELLREELQLTGTKHGCELGECGACAVLLDGQLVLSCLVAAVECDGRAVETVEGMQSGPELHPLQACFADHGAAQCGYCTPGFLLAAKELLERRPDATRAEIAEALSGQLCRCTGYLQIFEAVEAAARQMRK